MDMNLTGSARYRRLAWGLIGLIWYLPALHARTSSENFAGSFFLIGLCGVVLQLGRARGPAFMALAGFCLGLAFESRFQMGVSVFGFLAWLIFRAPLRPSERWTALWPILLGGMGAVALGRVIDWHFFV